MKRAEKEGKNQKKQQLESQTCVKHVVKIKGHNSKTYESEYEILALICIFLQNSIVKKGRKFKIRVHNFAQGTWNLRPGPAVDAHTTAADATHLQGTNR